MQHGTLFDVLCQPGWEGVGGRMGTCICAADSIHCSLETTTRLLIGYPRMHAKSLVVFDSLQSYGL